MLAIVLFTLSRQVMLKCCVKRPNSKLKKSPIKNTKIYLPIFRFSFFFQLPNSIYGSHVSFLNFAVNIEVKSSEDFFSKKSPSCINFAQSCAKSYRCGATIIPYKIFICKMFIFSFQ